MIKPNYSIVLLIKSYVIYLPWLTFDQDFLNLPVCPAAISIDNLVVSHDLFSSLV